MAVLDDIIKIEKVRCRMCGTCSRNCPVNAVIGDFQVPHKIDPNRCVNCGFCSSHCKFEAITYQDDTDRFMALVNDPNVKVAVQFSPSVRVAIGEMFGYAPGTDSTGKIVAALKELGVDYVYDTNVAADLTVIEEANEFVERLNDPDAKFPMFTSCCPAWVRYVEKYYPKFMPNVSTCRSPMQMYSPVIKEYHKNVLGEDVVVCAIMPCTAKKYEAKREEFMYDGKPATECVITCVEAGVLLKEAQIDFKNIEPQDPDDPFGYGTGGGAIFGVTGGVAEAVVRYVGNVVLGEPIEKVEELSETCGVRGYDFVKTASLKVGKRLVKIAVVHGLKNMAAFLGQIEAGDFNYDLIEVMACPVGCVGGAGMPNGDREKKHQRGNGLFEIDKASELKSSNQNPAMDFIYDNIVKDKKHELLHVHYHK